MVKVNKRKNPQDSNSEDIVLHNIGYKKNFISSIKVIVLYAYKVPNVITYNSST